MRVHQSHPVHELFVPASLTRPALPPWLAPLAIGGALRVLAALVAPLAPQWDGAIYVRGAEQLARGLGYTTAILAEGVASPKPTAFYPVGFPAILAGLRMLGGNRRADLVLQALAGTAAIAVTYLLARALGSTRTARRAAFLMALWPGGILLTTTWLAEPLVMLGVALSSLVLLRARRATFAARLALFGFGMGLTAYLRITPLLVAPIVAFGVGWARGGRRLRHALVAAAIALGFAVLPLAPWVARNLAVLDRPVLLSTNGGLNLLMGTRGEGDYHRFPPGFDCPSDLSEVEVDACRSHRALQRIAAHPFLWTARGLGKIWHLLGHESAPAQHLGGALAAVGRPTDVADVVVGITRFHWTVFLGLAIAGGLRVARRRFGRRHAILFGPIVGLAALHFVFIGGDRYHAVVVPMLAVLAAIGLETGRRSAELEEAVHPRDDERIPERARVDREDRRLDVEIA